MILPILTGYVHSGYIAGAADGIVTVNGVPATRLIIVLDADTLSYVRQTASLTNGHYLILGLDPDKRYLVLCRDHERIYEPAVWDYVTPMDDMTHAEQLALWMSWQTP